MIKRAKKSLLIKARICELNLEFFFFFKARLLPVSRNSTQDFGIAAIFCYFNMAIVNLCVYYITNLFFCTCILHTFQYVY